MWKLIFLRGDNAVYFLVIVGLLVVIFSVGLMNYNYSMIGSLVMIIGLAIMNYGYKKAKSNR